MQNPRDGAQFMAYWNQAMPLSIKTGPLDSMSTFQATTQQAEVIMHDNDDDDDEAESSDDGGVEIKLEKTEDSHSNPNFFHEEIESREIMLRTYGQTPITNLEDTSDLWRLPVPPLNIRKPRELKQLGIYGLVARGYQNHCRLIRKHWNCEPAACVPFALRNETPYSLALLSLLRKLASSTKNDFARAQSLLMKTWQKRVDRLAVRSEHNKLCIVETITTHVRSAEDKIQENVFGLTLSDVREARQIALAQRKQKNMAARAAAGPMTRTKRRNQRRRDAYKPLGELPESDGGSQYHPKYVSMSGTSLASPNSPVMTGRPLPGQDSRQRNTYGFKEYEGGFEGGYGLSKRDRTQETQMTKLLDNMGVDGGVQMRKSRLNKLSNGGLSRSDFQPTTLPSERFNLNYISSLRQPGSTATPPTLAESGQRPLPEY